MTEELGVGPADGLPIPSDVDDEDPCPHNVCESRTDLTKGTFDVRDRLTGLSVRITVSDVPSFGEGGCRARDEDVRTDLDDA